MPTHILRVPVSTGDTSLQRALRDDLLTGDNGGVLFCADLGFGWSYPAGNLPRPIATDPLPNALIRDISENGDGKTSSEDGTSAIQYLGGGFDFSNIADLSPREVGIEIPATVNTQLYINQNYLFCAYMRLPSLANWNSDPSLNGMITSSDSGGSYAVGVESFLIAMAKPNVTNGYLTFRAQDGAGTAIAVTLEIQTGQNFYDSAPVQVSLYTDGVNLHARLKSATAVLTGSSAFSGNSQDFSAQTIKVGGSSSGFRGDFKDNYRVYRTFVEDLSVSGRNPVTVLDEDFVRVTARGVFS